MEGVEEAESFLVGEFDGFPVEEIGSFLALDFPHDTAAGVGAGVTGRVGGGVFEAGGIPEAVLVGQGQPKSAVGMDLMEFEVLGFQPRFAPVEAFAIAEFGDQEFLANPIEDSDKLGGLGGQGLQDMVPEIKKGVGLFIASFK